MLNARSELRSVSLPKTAWQRFQQGGKVTAFLRQIEPDVEEMVDALFRRRLPRRVHFIELFLDTEIKEAARARFGLCVDINQSDPLYETKRDVAVHAFLGYDMFRVGIARKTIFKTWTLPAADTTVLHGQERDTRNWQEEHVGPIQGWRDFEAYPWPRISDLDLSALEWLEKNLLPNMGCFDLTAHIFEILSFLLGYETLCYAVVDQPDLVDAILEKVGSFYVEFTRVLADSSKVAVIWGSDDLGFRTGTMMSPEFLRGKILPWHARCADVAHARGKPYLLHSCGNLDTIMEDLIRDVGIDGKHSYEDTILPVTEAKKRYGGRISILGGIDMDFLCRASEPAIRKRVQDTLSVCREGGGYCLGTGNTVANYVPMDNYLAMLDEGRRFSL
jgi:uroporphyrinogen decarboxylase